MADTLTTALEQLKVNTKDYPSSWKACCAVDAFATAIYYCRATYYSLPATPWDELADGTREVYRRHAVTMLDGLAPQAVRSSADLGRELFALGIAINRAKVEELRGKDVIRALAPEPRRRPK